MRIQHNIMAMSAYRNYTNNVSAMKKNLERLSSGYKINRAGDDAAGLAISEKMRAQITGLETAQKNAKDGISLVQTAEGALTEVHDMLNRMVELATQSANGTYEDGTDRAQLEKELNQLKSEINRIADSSNFNGIKLLDGNLAGTAATAASIEIDGELSNATVTAVADGQVSSGKTQKGQYEIDLSSFEGIATGASNTQVTIAIKIGNVTIATATITGGEAVTAGSFTIDSTAAAGVSIAAGSDMKYQFKLADGKITFEMMSDPTSATECSEAMVVSITNVDNNTAGGKEGNQAHTYDVVIKQSASYADPRIYARGNFNLSTVFSDGIKDGSVLKIGDTTYTFAVGKNSKFKDVANVIDLTDKTESDLASAGAGQNEAARRLTAAAVDNGQFKVTNNNNSSVIYLEEKEGAFENYDDYDLAGDTGTGKTADGKWYKELEDGSTVSLVQIGTAVAKEATTASGGLLLQIGDTADSYNQLRVSINDCHVYSMGIEGGDSIEDITIANQDDAAKAIDVIKAAINYVSDVRGTLGATQNRLDHTINNLSVMTENIQDAESTIRDTDIAEEMMAYTKNNILIQSAQAMLAQANQVPQGVLQLLQ